jgi:hypothetical protein
MLCLVDDVALVALVTLVETTAELVGVGTVLEARGAEVDLEAETGLVLP